MFEPIVPLMGKPANMHLAEDIERMHREFNIHRFVLCGPVYGSVSIHGLPAKEEFVKFAEEIRELNEHFASENIEICWWCVCTMDNGAEHPEFQHVVNHDGNVSSNALCPLDPNWRKEFMSRIRIVTEIARPKLILIEDDFELSNQVGVKFGCFCPLHMKKFSDALGKSITREELIAMYQKDTPETREIKRLFTKTVRDSIFLLAREIRDTVDMTDPKIRIGVCEPAVSDRDGYLSIDEPRIFAGKAARPLIRVEGSLYSCRNASSTLPETLAHAMYTFERLPEDYEAIHESDTYPHSRYFMSAHFFNGLLLGAVACGAKGSLLYGTQYLDDALEDDGYFRIYAKNAKKISALAEALRNSELDGLHLLYSPELKQRTLPEESLNQLLPSMTALAGRFGVPYSTKNGSSAFLIGSMADCLSDEEILALLSKGLILDAQSAEKLFQRGFGQYLGVEVGPMNSYRFCQEKLCNIPELSHIRGRSMYNYATYPAGSENDHAPYVELTLRGAEELSYFADYNGCKTNTATVRFQNSLGGRVGIFASGVVGNGTSGLFCYRKKELFCSLLEWVNRNPMPAVVIKRANVWLLVRRAEKRTFFLITDLNGDDDREMVIRFSEEFVNRKFKELQMDGSWKEIDLKWNGTLASVPGRFERLVMRVLVC